MIEPLCLCGSKLYCGHIQESFIYRNVIRKKAVLKSFSRVQLFVTPWTIAHQAPLSMGILQARLLEWVIMPSSRVSSQSRDQTQVSDIAGGFFTVWATREAQKKKLGMYIEISVFDILVI